MADSLQQQLINAGLVSQERAEELSKPKPKRLPRKRPSPTKGTKGKSRTSSQARDTSPKKQKTSDEKSMRSKGAKQAKAVELDAKAEADMAAKRELKAKIKTLIEANSVTDFKGDLSFSYIVGERIRQLFVTQEYLNKISAGELAITRLNRQTHLVTPEVAEQLTLLNPQWLVVFNDPNKEQPKVSEASDPYADYKVPDDLHW